MEAPDISESFREVIEVLVAARNLLPAVVSLFGYRGMLSDDSVTCLVQM